MFTSSMFSRLALVMCLAALACAAWPTDAQPQLAKRANAASDPIARNQARRAKVVERASRTRAGVKRDFPSAVPCTPGTVLSSAFQLSGVYAGTTTPILFYGSASGLFGQAADGRSSTFRFSGTTLGITSSPTAVAVYGMSPTLSGGVTIQFVDPSSSTNTMNCRFDANNQLSCTSPDATQQIVFCARDNTNRQVFATVAGSCPPSGFGVVTFTAQCPPT